MLKKMAKRFTVKPIHGFPVKESFVTLERAYDEALALARKTGKDVAVIQHEGDITSLVKKVIHTNR